MNQIIWSTLWAMLAYLPASCLVFILCLLCKQKTAARMPLSAVLLGHQLVERAEGGDGLTTTGKILHTKSIKTKRSELLVFIVANFTTPRKHCDKIEENRKLLKCICKESLKPLKNGLHNCVWGGIQLGNVRKQGSCTFSKFLGINRGLQILYKTNTDAFYNLHFLTELK